MDSGQEVTAVSVLSGERCAGSAIGQTSVARAGCTGVGQRQDNGSDCRTGLEVPMNGNGATERGAGTDPVTDPLVTGEGQLWALLQDLLEREGRDAAAERLGLSERTIRRTLAERRLSRKMTDALLRERNRRRAEQGAQAEEHEQSEEGVQGGAGVVEPLEARVATLETELKEWNECNESEFELLDRQLRSLAGQLGLALSPRLGANWERHLAPRTHPQLVTLEPASDDPEVYGAALPVVAAWRRALRALNEAPHRLGRLNARERQLRLELQLIDDRRLTLPPAEAAWDTVRRATELRLRLSSLDRVRLQRSWAFPLHYAGRILSLGMWGRGPTLEQQLQRELEARQAELLRPQLEPQAERGREGGSSITPHNPSLH